MLFQLKICLNVKDLYLIEENFGWGLKFKLMIVLDLK